MFNSGKMKYITGHFYYIYVQFKLQEKNERKRNIKKDSENNQKNIYYILTKKQ